MCNVIVLSKKVFLILVGVRIENGGGDAEVSCCCLG